MDAPRFDLETWRLENRRYEEGLDDRGESVSTIDELHSTR